MLQQAIRIEQQCCEIISLNHSIFTNNIGGKAVTTKSAPDNGTAWAHNGMTTENSDKHKG
jgi:hypothetical protein